MSDISAMKAHLIAALPALVAQWFPGGRRDGHRYWPRSTRRGKTDASLCIDISGPYAGRFVDFGDAAIKGDAIDLVAYAAFGLTPPDGRREAILWLKDFVGARVTPCASPANRAAPLVSDCDDAEQARRDDLARRARGWWFAAAPLAGTHGAAYLAARGIDIARLARPPGAIRFHPRLRYVGPDEPKGRDFPGLLTCMTDAGGAIRAVHRTFLDAQEPRKARVERAKKMWGDARGCSMRLARGASGLSPEDYARAILAGRRDAQDVQDIIEGIEDGLTWALIEPAARVTAAGSLSMIATAPLFACAREIRVIGDNDESPQTRAAVQAAARAVKERAGGRPVSLLRPVGAKDINEAWQTDRGAA